MSVEVLDIMSVKNKEKRRALRVRRKLQSARGLPRVSVFRSLKYTYAQLIDDTTRKTLASCSSIQVKDLNGDKTAVAHAVGELLADKIKALGIQAAIFDRGSYRYHGRVKAVADGLREKDIQI